MSNCDKRESYHNKFLNIEEEFSLLHKKFQGVNSWARLRNQIYRDIVFNRSGKISNDKGFPLSKVPQYFNKLINNFKYLISTNTHDNTLLFWGQDRRIQLSDGIWWDIHCDPIINNINHSYIHIEFSNQDYSRIETANNLPIYFIEYLSRIYRRIYSNKINLNNDEIDIILEIEASLKEDLNIDIELLELIKGDIATYSSQLILYNKLLNHIQPEIFLFSSYNYYKKTLVELCYHNDIPVVELQHGRIGNYDLRYSEAGLNIPDKLRPDYLFCFGNTTKEIIDDAIDTNIRITGYPFLEEEISPKVTNDNSNRILFISQPTVGGKLSEIAIQLNSNLDYEFIYKLHPSETKNDYPQLKRKNIEVIGDEKSIYELLPICKIHIGVNSTSLYEGLFFNPVTIVIDMDGADFISEIVYKNNVYVANNTDELIYNIQNINKIDTTPNHRDLFEVNSICNIKKELESIL